MYLILGLAVISLGFAYLTWKYVERPFRNKHRISRKKLFLYWGIGSVFFILIGLAGHYSEGYSKNQRWHRIQNVLIVQKERGAGNKLCSENRIVSQLGPIVCIIGDESIKPSGVLWGDSLAGALIMGLDEQLSLKRRSFYAVISDGCPPIEGGSKSGFRCTEDRQKQFVSEVLKQPDIKTIIWFGSFTPASEKNVEDQFIDGNLSTPSIFEKRLNQTLAKLIAGGKEVILIGDTPRFPQPVAEYAIKSYLITGGDLSATIQTISKQEQLNNTKNLSRILNAMQKKTRVVDGYSPFCNGDVCSSHDDNGNLMFVDRNHLSSTGALRMSKLIVDFM